MKLQALGLLLLCWTHVCTPKRRALGFHRGSKDWIRKEVGAVIYMTLEFVKDMEMKMRDVHRVQKDYEFYDFGAARLYTAVTAKFDRIVKLYQNYSSVEYLFGRDRNSDQLLSDVVGSLQFMLGDYGELISLIEVFKERYTHWKTSAARSRYREIVEQFLVGRDIFPSKYQDEW